MLANQHVVFNSHVFEEADILKGPRHTQGYAPVRGVRPSRPPLNSISPLFGRISPVIILKSVDFPAPLGPIIPCTEPGYTYVLIPSSTFRPPNLLEMFLNSRIGSFFSNTVHLLLLLRIMRICVASALLAAQEIPYYGAKTTNAPGHEDGCQEQDGTVYYQSIRLHKTKKFRKECQ